MSEKRNIRIKDIAELAGVSVGTVDRVLHNRGKVSDDARKKVEEVLGQTGYKPNIIARTLGSNKSLKIAVLIPDPAQDEYWKLSAEGIEQSKTEWAHYGVEISAHFFDLYKSTSYEARAQEALVNTPDALLTAPIFYKQSLQFLNQLDKDNTPYLLFNTEIPESRAVSFIGQDLYQSGKVAGELLAFGPHDKNTVLVLHINEDVSNATHLLEKEKGVKDFFANSQVTVKSIAVTDTREAAAQQQIKEAIEQPDLKGIFISSSKGTHLIADLLENYQKTEVPLIGYDTLKKNVAHLKKGVVNFLINQNPQRMTQVGISQLINHVMFHKSVPAKELFPLEIITQQNVDSYLKSTIG
ncbi:LacI family DNA-binding transcriptional regulator [Marinoscillum furvescens]|uniref:LacI family transcriptional regulator n=1 Tax=Marinoscillum furvescens DSM 4134 TaxID=1122208 RepID=A0A3D9KY50_MARFU|nr:LacI family DNA-binding transcriptional regulator [Marinoscillum furvescens]RED92292.1 LacI family transcriptional regulator [Marinoscillum furvescens DSM 4134]